VSTAYFNIGGCGGGDGDSCDPEYNSVAVFICASLVTTQECDSFEYIPDFFFPGECKLFGCKVGCDRSRPILPPRNPGFFNPDGIAVTRNGDFVVTDSGLNSGHWVAVLLVDHITGGRTIISDENTGAGPDLRYPSSIAVTADGDFVVIDDDLSGSDVVVLIDHITGDRTIISDDNTGSGPDLISPRDIVVATDGNFVVIDNDRSGSGAVVLINQITGNRTIISDNNTGSGPGFINPNGIAVTGDGDFVVTETRLGAVVHVDRNTGDRTILSDENTGSGPILFTLNSIAMTTDGDFVVTDNSLQGVMHIDHITGDRTILSDESTGSGPDFGAPTDIAVTTNGDIVVIDQAPTMGSYGAIVLVDQITGDRTIISEHNW